MTEAEKILKMIEGVSPEDEISLRVIEAQVWCWLKGFEYGQLNLMGRLVYRNNGRLKVKNTYPKYTRSRDALKAIRPNGWSLTVVCNCGLPASIARMYNEDTFISPVTTPDLPTEELAELHAIIQAIEYERNNL